MFFITDNLLTRILPADAVRKLVDSGVIAALNAGELGRAKRRHWQGSTVADCAHIASLRDAGLSLFEAAAVRALGGTRWRGGPLSVVSHPHDVSELQKIMTAKQKAQPNDWLIDIVNGKFVFERRGTSKRTLIARLQGNGRVVGATGLEANVRAFANDEDIELPLDFGILPEDIAAQQAANPITIATVNIDFAARTANQAILRDLSFVAI
jgi:hypothetical protein